MPAVIQLMTRMMLYNTLLCCGLDPDLNKIPTSIRGTPEERVLKFLKDVVDVTAEHVCAYKAQKAFFDMLIGGHEVLAEVITYIHSKHSGIPVIVDCKIGDIGNTMQAYTHNLFGLLQADGLLVNPYMGDDALLPLGEYADKAIIVLAKTSNPAGDGIIQDVILSDGRPLWQYVLDLIITRWNRNGNMIPTLSSTVGLDMAAVRRQIPNNMPILLAGVGAQGGNYNDLSRLVNRQGVGVFVGSSRGILYPPSQRDHSWLSEVEMAAIELKDRLNHARGAV